MRSIVCIAFLLASKLLTAQETKSKVNWFTFTDDPHSPKKATVYSAVFPGLGQAYNHKYWKIPVIYAAMGGGTYYMLNKRAQMRTMNADFTTRYADANTANDPSSRELSERDNLRRSRDIGILVLSGLYALQIVDATVDAHFYKIDINQNLNVQLLNSNQFLQLSYTF